MMNLKTIYVEVSVSTKVRVFAEDLHDAARKVNEEISDENSKIRDRIKIKLSENALKGHLWVSGASVVDVD